MRRLVDAALVASCGTLLFWVLMNATRDVLITFGLMLMVVGSANLGSALDNRYAGRRKSEPHRDRRSPLRGARHLHQRLRTRAGGHHQERGTTT